MKNEDYSSQLGIGKVSISKELLGGNSSVLKGVLNDGTVVAIKKYKGDHERVSRMLSREHEAVTFLHKNGVLNIPELLEVRPDLGLIVFRWIEGTTPPANHESMNAIIDMSTVLDEMYVCGSRFENAIDAGFSGGEIESQILNRTQQMQASYPFEWIDDVCIQINERLGKFGSDLRKSQVFHRRTFSFSDLGTHNIIYSENRFNFIDFEFFGIDSVNKLVGDFLLHPRNDFNQFEITRFIDISTKIFKWSFEELKEFLPILALKWAVIAYGRTLRELRLEFGDDLPKQKIMKSKGALYLEYFDFLWSSKNIDVFTTFRAFEGKVNR
jgi:tRNA A-37 threonylcarbamoyl transferase component Bud32